MAADIIFSVAKGVEANSSSCCLEGAVDVFGINMLEEHKGWVLVGEDVGIDISPIGHDMVYSVG